MSTLLTAKNILLQYASKTFLDDLTFTLNEREIIGLVGRNGCGKTSLMRILAGKQDFDGGEIEIKNNVKIGYLPQDFDLPQDQTIAQTLQNASQWVKNLIAEFEQLPSESQEKHNLMQTITDHYGWEMDKHIEGLCTTFDVSNLDKKLSECSGGQQRRVALVCAMIGFPDVLILDEPTNHLDLGTIEKLEKLIKNYQGCVLMVSHDRYFLDNTVNKMWELWNGQFFTHQGNYSKYLENKSIRMEIENSREWKKQQYLKRELEWVNAGVQARSTKDKGRLKRYYGLKNEGDLEQEMSVNVILPEPKEMGARVLELENVYLDIYDQNVINNLTYSFQPGQKIGIIGNNGVGKTTFLNLLMGQYQDSSLPIREYPQSGGGYDEILQDDQPELKGTVKIGINTEFLYFDQKKVGLDLEKSAVEELTETNEQMYFGDKLISTHKYLQNWLFDKSKRNTPVEHLSGGEKSRLMLAKILAKGGNFLVLDEPTNDLDLDTLRVLEENLEIFDGTVIIVSHDRYFLNRVCTDILSFEGNGAIIPSTGNYDDYLSKKIDPEMIKSYRDAIKKQRKQSEEKVRDAKNKISRLEQEIEKTEAKISELQAQFDDPELYIKDPERVKKLHKMITDRERDLEKLMSDWECLSSTGMTKSEILESSLEGNATAKEYMRVNFGR
jgi:ABC transport system ATP-binding/permease protein